jgi:hypothetical protein
MNVAGPRRLRAFAGAVAAALALAGCATTYAPQRLELPTELHDVRSKAQDDVMVTVSILTDEQAARHFGADFGRHGLQALWMSVRNGSDRRYWFIRSVLDPDYYSAEEAALLIEADVSRESRAGLHQALRDESIRSRLEARTVTEGFVFLPRVEGGRYVDVRLQADAYDEVAGPRTPPAPGTGHSPGARRELRFEFALPLPDGDFDYERLDPNRTYAGRSLPNLHIDEFRAALERLPCCAADADGQEAGDPLNVVLVGEPNHVLHSLTRAGWSFTHRISLRTVQREVGSALKGDPYLVAPVSSLYVFGRRQDVALQRARRSIAQRNHMRLWLAPFRFEDRSVWVGQISRDIGIKVTPKSPTLTTHIIDPEVDTTREYLLHSLVAQGFVDRFGFARGSAAGTPAEPRYNLTGDPYHSDGLRLVVILAPQPVPPDQIRNLAWEQSAAPIAEGQSDAARRNVRPIDPGPKPQ